MKHDKVSMANVHANEVLIKQERQLHELGIVEDFRKLEEEHKEIQKQIKEEVQRHVNWIEQDAVAIETIIEKVQIGNVESYLGYAWKIHCVHCATFNPGHVSVMGWVAEVDVVLAYSIDKVSAQVLWGK